MKNVPQYVKNLGKSIKYASVDVLKDIVPNVAETIETNNELYQELINVTRNHRIMINRASNMIKQSKVYEASTLLKSSLIEDIQTGNLYNKSRKDAIESKIMGLDDMMGDDFDFDDSDFNFGDDEEEYTPDGKDEYLNDSISQNSEASARMISDSIVRATEYSVENQKALFEFQMMQNMQNFNNINSNLTTINDNIGKIINIGEIATTHMQNSKTYYEESTKILKENTSLIKELVEMERNRYQSQQEESKGGSKKIEYQDVVSASGVPDIKEYINNIGKNITNKFSSISNMNESFGEDSNLLLTFVSSPLEFIPKFFVANLITKNLKDSMKNLDKSIGSFFSSMISRFNTMAKDDNYVYKTIGEIFGLKNNLDTKINTANYTKGAVQWDGKARQALIEVIPSHLSKIVSLLSGKPEKIYDYDRGTFIESRTVKKEYDERIDSSVKTSSSDVRDAMEEILNKNFAFKDYDNKMKFDEDMDKFFKHFFNTGAFFDYNRKSYEDYDDVISNEDNYEIIRSLFKNLPRHLQLQFNKDILDGRDSLNKSMRTYEKDGDSVYRYLNNNYGIDEYFKKDKFDHERVSGIGSNSDLLNVKDTYGNNIFFYLKKMTSTLLEGIKVYVTNSGGSGRRYGNNNPKSPILDRDTNINNKTGKSDSENKAETERRDSERFTRNEEKRANKNNLRYIDDIAYNSDNDVSIDAVITNENDVRKRAEQYKSKKKGAVSEFIDDLLDGTTLLDKYQIVTDKIQSISKIPTNSMSKFLDRVDMRLYEVIYGKKERKYEGETVKGFLDMLMVDLKRTFSTFNDWMDEKILTPLQEKFGGTTSKIFDGILTGLGINMTSSEAMTKVKTFFFGEKDEDGEYLQKGLMSDFKDQVTADIHSIKRYTFGKNSTFRKIYKIVLSFSYDKSKHNSDGIEQTILDINSELLKFRSTNQDEINLAKSLKKEIDKFTYNANGEDILSNILKQLQSNGYGDADTSLAGTLKNSFKTAKEFTFGNNNDLDKLYKFINRDIDDLRKFAFLNKPSKDTSTETVEYAATNDLINKNIGQEYIDKVNEYTMRFNGETQIRPEDIPESVFNMKPDGSHSAGLDYVPFDGYIAKLHKGERVVPAEDVSEFEKIRKKYEDHFNKNLPNTINERMDKFNPFSDLDGESKDNIIKLLTDYDGADIDRLKEDILSEVKRNRSERGRDIEKPMIDQINEEVHNMVREIKIRLIGDDSEQEKMNQKLNDAISDTAVNIKHYAPKLGSGALIGGGLGLLTGAIGGPLLWATVGAATSLTKNSEKVQDYLFGENVNNERQGGLVSKSIIDTVNKYAPDLKKYGVTGAALGLMPFTPVGVVGGLTLGAATSFAKNNTEFQNFLYGDNGIIGEEGKEKFKKNLPKLLAGAGLGGIAGSLAIGSIPFIGPLGMMGGITMGAATSYATTTDSFKNMMFGEEGSGDDKGLLSKNRLKKMKEFLPKALIGTLAASSLTPFGLLGSSVIGATTGIVASSDHFKDAVFGKADSEGKRQGGMIGGMKSKISDFIDNSIKKPFKNSMAPFIKEFQLVGKTMKDSVKSAIDKVFENSFGKPLGELVNDKIVKPFTSLFQKIFGIFGKIVGTVAASPFKVLGKIAEDLKVKHVKQGNATYLTKEEQDQVIKDHPYKFLFGTKHFSKALGHLFGFNKTEEDQDDDIVDDIVEEVAEQREDSKKTIMQIFTEKITSHYTDLSNKYGKFKDRVKDKYNNGKNNMNTVVSNAVIAADAQIDRETKDDPDDSEEDPGQSDNEEARTKLEKEMQDVIDEKTATIKELQETIEELKEVKKETKSEESKSSDSNKDDEDISGSDIKDIRNYTSIIADEISGQLDGVGYNIETIKNILVENLGEPEEEATGEGTNRGNKKRKGILGRIFGFLQNPMNFMKNGGKYILFGKDGEGGLLGWSVKLGNKIKNVILAPFKLVKEAYNTLKGAGQFILEGVKMIGPAIGEVLSATVKTLVTPIEALGSVITGLGEGLGKGLGALAEGFGVLGGQVLKLTSVIPKAIDLAIDLTYQLGKTLIDFGAFASKFVFGGLGKVTSKIFGLDKVKKQEMEVTIKGGKLDLVDVVNKVKEVDVANKVKEVDIIYKIKEVLSSMNNTQPALALPTEYGVIRYHTNFRGEQIPIQNDVYRDHMRDKEKDDSVIEDIRDSISKNAEQTEEISKNTSALDKIKSGASKIGNFFNTIKPFLFLALPFLPKIYETLKSGFSWLKGTGILDAIGGTDTDGDGKKDTGVGGLANVGIELAKANSKKLVSFAWNIADKYIDDPGKSIVNNLVYGKNFIAKGARRGLNMTARGLSKAVPKFIGIVKKIFTNPRVVKVITKVMPKNGANICARLANGLPGKILKKAGPNIGKAISKAASNIMLPITIGLVVYDLLSGMADAEEILQMSGDLPIKFRVISGVVKAVNSRITFGLLPQKFIMDVIIDIFGSDEEKKDISESQQRLLSEWNEYNESNPNAPVDFDEFNENRRKFNMEERRKHIIAMRTQSNHVTSNKPKLNKNKINQQSLYGRGVIGTTIMKNAGAYSGFFSQNNPIWGNMQYNSPYDTIKQTIDDSGCGPTAAAMMVNNLTGQNITPDIAANYALDNGFKEPNGGTYPEFFNSFMSQYGINSNVLDLKGDNPFRNMYQIRKLLKSGSPVVLMGSDNKATTPFGNSPHYVMATGIDENGNIIINDPESSEPNKSYNLNDTLGSSTLSIITDRMPNMNTGSTSDVKSDSFIDAMNPITQMIELVTKAVGRVYGNYMSGDNSTSTSSSYEYNTNYNPPKNTKLSANEFIKKIMPAAIATGRRYNILPSLTVAQAILESAWGKKSIGNNIFGIKASSSWRGKTKSVMTTEYRNGVKRNERALFRDYNSIDESIADHAKLLLSSRYKKVRSAKNYVEAAYAIKEAGYATDPNYPKKLISIIEKYGLFHLDDKIKNNSYGTGKDKSSTGSITDLAKTNNPIFGKGNNKSSSNSFVTSVGTGIKHSGGTTSSNINNNTYNNQSSLNDSLLKLIIELMTKVVQNTNSLSEIATILSEGLNINIPKDKLKNIKNNKESLGNMIVANMGSSSEGTSNPQLLNVINMLNDIASQ